MPLLDYQRECVEIINRCEKGNYLIQLATGLGAREIASSIKRKGRVLLLSDGEEQVHQLENYYGHRCTFGVEMNSEESHGEEAVSASVRTLVNRLDRFRPDDFDMIITTEAHHAVAPSYLKIYDYFKPRLHVGFTATPNRGDRLRLDMVFDKILYQKDIRWGIENGYICDIDCQRKIIHYDITGIGESGDDFSTKELVSKMDREDVNREVAHVYEECAIGQTLIFASSVEHAKNIAGLIEGAIAYTNDLPNRMQVLEDFKTRKVKCLVTCNLLTEGVEIPTIETIMIARPTKNLGLYTQMVGRGMFRIQGEKEVLHLIDLIGISNKTEICTAPNLMGLSLENIPLNNREMLNGRLSDLEKKIEQESNTISAWLHGEEVASRYSREHKLDFCNVDYALLSNGDLLCNVPKSKGGINKKCRIYVKAQDNLGMSQIEIKLYSKETEEEKDWTVETRTTPAMPIQVALNRVYEFLKIYYPVEEKVWNVAMKSAYSKEKVSEKQLGLLAKCRQDDRFKDMLKDVDFESLTKNQATQILNHLYGE